jgi:dipeptidyl aminopeptidase/acylaminoacyl peptidase
MSGKIEKPPENLSGRVVVWDVESGREVWSTSSAYGQVRDLAFSPVGNHLAVTYWGFKQAVPSPNGAVEVVVYDAERGGKRFQLCTDIPNRIALTFDPSGRRIATSQSTEGGRGEVKVWDADSGRELLTLPSGEHAGSIRFTPDGAKLSAWGSSSVYAGLPPVWDATPRPEPKK